MVKLTLLIFMYLHVHIFITFEYEKGFLEWPLLCMNVPLTKVRRVL
jgi:hypothetical protein